MKQQQKTRFSWKVVTYHSAKWAWLITAWTWSTIIFGLLVQLAPTLLTLEEPASHLPSTWAGETVHWLSTPNDAPTLETLREIALVVIILLVVIPPLAFMLKQVLENPLREDLEDRQQEDFDKLIDVLQKNFDKIVDALQKDTILPQMGTTIYIWMLGQS